MREGETLPMKQCMEPLFLRETPRVSSARVELASEYIQQKPFRLVLLDATVGYFIPLL